MGNRNSFIFPLKLGPYFPWTLGPLDPWALRPLEPWPIVPLVGPLETCTLGPLDPWTLDPCNMDPWTLGPLIAPLEPWTLGPAWTFGFLDPWAHPWIPSPHPPHPPHRLLPPCRAPNGAILGQCGISGNVAYSGQCYIFWASLHILGIVTYYGLRYIFGALLHHLGFVTYLGLCGISWARVEPGRGLCMMSRVDHPYVFSCAFLHEGGMSRDVGGI